MGELFGVDLAAAVWEAVQAAGGLTPGVLIHQQPRQRQSDGSYVTPDPTRHTFQGVVETRAAFISDTLVPAGTAFLTIIGNSITPAVRPAVKDQAEMNGQTYNLIDLTSEDPASAAYQFRVTVA